MTAKWY